MVHKNIASAQLILNLFAIERNISYVQRAEVSIIPLILKLRIEVQNL